MEITYYGYPKCSTCRKAKKWLEVKELNFNEVNIAETPPTEDELREIISASGLEIKKFFNTSGKVYRELKLKDKLPTMTEVENIGLITSEDL